MASCSYTMPYISGESLSSRLAHAPRLLVAESIAIAVDVADALAYAHQTGVVHRDVKPANILLEGGHAVVMDFGIALAMQHSAADDTTPITLPGSLVGTPRYMSPEQASGDRADARSDLYSLACVLFEMLTGYPPFVGPSSQSVLVQHLVQPPPAIRRDDVPESVKTHSTSHWPSRRMPATARRRNSAMRSPPPSRRNRGGIPRPSPCRTRRIHLPPDRTRRGRSTRSQCCRSLLTAPMPTTSTWPTASPRAFSTS